MTPQQKTAFRNVSPVRSAQETLSASSLENMKRFTQDAVVDGRTVRTIVTAEFLSPELATWTASVSVQGNNDRKLWAKLAREALTGVGEELGKDTVLDLPRTTQYRRRFTRTELSDLARMVPMPDLSAPFNGKVGAWRIILTTSPRELKAKLLDPQSSTVVDWEVLGMISATAGVPDHVSSTPTLDSAPDSEFVWRW